MPLRPSQDRLAVLQAEAQRRCGVPGGQRAPAGADLVYLPRAVRPGTDEAFALVIPEVSAAAMQAFLDGFAATLPEKVHAALLLDGAGWHIAQDITVPANVSLVFLPPYAPKLNPVERLWLFLRERFLSLRLFADLEAIIAGCCDAWNRLAAEPGRTASLTDYPYLRSVRIS